MSEQPASKQSAEAYRVFCEKHDEYSARYTNGRPLLDDRCPRCIIEQLSTRLADLQDASAERFL